MECCNISKQTILIIIPEAKFKRRQMIRLELFLKKDPIMPPRPVPITPDAKVIIVIANKSRIKPPKMFN